MQPETQGQKPKEAAPRQPVVGVVPFGFRPAGALAEVPLTTLLWPLGEPDLPPGACIRDLGPDDHVCAFADSWLFAPSLGRRRRGFSARLSLAIAEPTGVHGHLMVMARLLHRRFYRILTCNPRLLAALPNGQKLIFGDAWVDPKRDYGREKTRMLSLIASRKRRLSGHRLRHKAVRALAAKRIAVDVMGRGYRAFEDKAEGLAPYRYSVVIENSRQTGYITEKVIDAFLCRTVPIYWGAPDIGDYFNTDGMIVCTTLAQIVAAAKSLSAEDYAARKDAIEENRRRARAYGDVIRAAAWLVRDGS